MEARVGIEPTIEDLQSSALPLGDRAIRKEYVDTRLQLDQVKILLIFIQLKILLSTHLPNSSKPSFF